jgi:S-adenosylhomocysteine hydrolase
VSDGFRVDVAALDGYGRKLDELAGRMQQAAAAGRPLDRLAYGLIGQGFAQLAVGVADSGSAVVRDLARQSVAIADGFRATRDAYLQAEERVVTVLGGACGGPR